MSETERKVLNKLNECKKTKMFNNWARIMRSRTPEVERDREIKEWFSQNKSAVLAFLNNIPNIEREDLSADDRRCIDYVKRKIRRFRELVK